MEKARLKIEVRFRFDGKEYKGVSSFISAGGLMINSIITPAVDAKVLLTLVRFDGGDDMRCMGRVHMVFEPPAHVPGFLLEFEHLEPEDMNRIKDYITKASPDKRGIQNGAVSRPGSAAEEMDKYILKKEIQKISREFDEKETKKRDIRDEREKRIVVETMTYKQVFLRVSLIALLALLAGVAILLLIEPMALFFIGSPR